MINPEEAPDGYKAVENPEECLACDLCIPLDDGRLEFHHLCESVPCCDNERKDGHEVIFKKKGEEDE